MYKLWFAMLGAVLLSGCIGSAYVLDNYDEDVTYPNLQTVPERPPHPDFEKMKQQEAHLKQAQQQELDFNQRLRQQAL